MSNNNFVTRMLAAFGAVTITATLLISSFATPASTIFTGVLA